ncbi:unnamed protein product [Gordionus sp. m RMFG-2023]
MLSVKGASLLLLLAIFLTPQITQQVEQTKDNFTSSTGTPNPILEEKLDENSVDLILDDSQWKILLLTASKKIDSWFDEMNTYDKNLAKNKTEEGKSAGKDEQGNKTVTDVEDDLSPNDFRIILSGRNDEVDEIAKKAFVALEISSRLAKDQNLTGKSVSSQLGKVKLPDDFITKYCPFNEYGREAKGRNYIDKSHKYALYRSPDGSFNNPFDPYKGRSSIPFKRLLPPDFSDGIQLFRLGSDGYPLPDTRTVSLLIHHLPDSLLPNRHSEFPYLTLLMTQWGQLTIHDLTLTPLSKVPGSKCCVPYNADNPSCAIIPLKPDDPFFSRYGKDCMEFTRSSPSFRRDCTLGPKETLNQVTSYLDASILYGSSVREENLLRAYEYGELIVRDKVFFNDILDFLPLHPNGTQKGCVGEWCYMAGDVRCNENPGLTALHVIWLREHNRLARGLASLNPHWNDERIFQETKRIVVAQYQHINYFEYLPIVLGKKIIKLYPDLKVSPIAEYYYGYSPELDPGTSQAFSTSAFRFGHSMVADKLIYVETTPQFTRETVTYLREGYFRPSLISGHSYPSLPDNILQGLLYQKSYIMDNYASPELVDHLYQTKPSVPGLDLIALDIQRGRDHGLPAYNNWRVWCGLKPFTTFDELAEVMPIDLVDKFRSLYTSVDDIDLVSAGMSEYWIYDSIVGPTYACIITEQMIRLRKGDRFWYENGPGSLFTNPFTLDQLNEIKKTWFSHILCRNAPLIKDIQLNAFFDSKYMEYV